MEALAQFAIQFNDVVVMVALIDAAVLVFAPAHVRQILQWGILIWVWGVLGQVAIILTQKTPEVIGMVFRFTPDVITLFFFISFMLYGVTLFRVLRQPRRRRRSYSRRQRNREDEYRSGYRRSSRRRRW